MFVWMLPYLKNELMVYETFCNICIEILAFDESKKEFIHYLYMRPRHFKYRLVFLRIKCLALWIDRWRYWSEKILAEHINHPRVHGLRDDLPIVRHVVQELMEREPFNFFRLHITASIIEVEYNVTLVDLLHEKILPPIWRYFMETWQLLQLTLPLIRYIEPR